MIALIVIGALLLLLAIVIGGILMGGGNLRRHPAQRPGCEYPPGNSPAVDAFIHHLGEEYDRRAGRKLPGYDDYATYTVRPDEPGGEQS